MSTVLKPKRDRERLRHVLDDGTAALAAALERLSNAMAEMAEHLRNLSEKDDARERAVMTRPDVQDALAVGLRELRESRDEREPIS